jgi:hypothetical protein
MPTLLDLDWSPWVPLEGAQRHPAVPRAPGLYRIRSAGTHRILYVGQTGRTLRQRLRELKGVFGDEMPYNDPHTAGPALWAHRIDTGEAFEVSVAVLEVDKADRLGREALEVTKQRIIDGCSPAYNFGRMPYGWWPSRGSNTKANKAAGKYVRGRRMTDEELAALPPDESVPPPTTLEGDARAADWLGLAWRETDIDPPGRGAVGVYRIATRPHGPLDYLGQGLIVSRWRSHADGWVTDLAAERTDATAWGWVPLEIGSRQLLEVENDLIASHMVIFARPPAAQFGRSR